MGVTEPLTHKKAAQLTQDEVTRRAVARMTLDEWLAWMKLEGERLPTSSILGKQAEVRAGQLLAAEGMGLGAMDVLEGSEIFQAGEPCPMFLLEDDIEGSEILCPLILPEGEIEGSEKFPPHESGQKFFQAHEPGRIIGHPRKIIGRS